MVDVDRRDFLKLAGAGAAALALPPGVVDLPAADALTRTRRGSGGARSASSGGMSRARS
jgi:hypothetical protein